MRILGPLVCSTTLPVTETFDNASASVVTSPPSTYNTAGKVCSVPGSPSSFSTSTTSPTATLYCLPPVLTIAYADTEVSCITRQWVGARTIGPPPGRRSWTRAATCSGGRPYYRLRGVPRCVTT